VVGDESSLFFLLEFSCLVHHLAYALSQQNSMLIVTEDFKENIMCLLGLAEPEGSHTDLRITSVVKDLKLNVLGSNQLAHMRLHQQILCLPEPVVQRQMVNLIEDGTNFHARVAVDLNLFDEVADYCVRVLEQVDTLQVVVWLLWRFTLGGETRLDALVNAVVFVVQVRELDDAHSRHVALLGKLGEEIADFVNEV